MISTPILFFAWVLASLTLIHQVSAGADLPYKSDLHENLPRDRQLTGRVVMKRKTEKELRSKGKSKQDIKDIRKKGREEIEKNKVVFESRQLDIQVVHLGAPGLEKAFIKRQMNGSNRDLFEYVEEDYLELPDMTPNDSEFSQQWQHTQMQSVLAWDTSTGSSNITVAICDTGIQLDHPDLVANMAEGYNAVDQKWVSEGGSVAFVQSWYPMCGLCRCCRGK